MQRSQEAIIEVGAAEVVAVRKRVGIVRAIVETAKEKYIVTIVLKANRVRDKCAMSCDKVGIMDANVIKYFFCQLVC